MYIVTNADQKVYIGQDFTNNMVNIKAEGTGLFYVVNPGDDFVVRTVKAQIATTGLTDSTFVVADSSIFRAGEVLGWFATGGTTRKGSIRIESIVDATHILVRVDENLDVDNNDLESGDLFQYLPDQYISDGDCIEIKTRRSTTILMKADAANTELNMICTKLDATVQKKN